jgi:eukaryotic-like serine/threonine-protein kinase
MPDQTRTAADVGTASAATSGEPPAPAHTASPPAARYVLGDEIARGGMGAVHRATDTALGREVAVKVLLDKYAPGSGTARRFHDEARITGQLQHPNIPAVHDLGTLPDGRPFMAMRLIKGDTLDALLAARPDPVADRGRFVAVFEQVCQAVAYAHAHGIIHRDLKPANVMVGAFGEVQVMDWGLAKVLPSRGHARPGSDPDETASATDIHPLRNVDRSFTQAGSVLGTPAFMPPEQAAGAVGKIDARSDVFGLGAVLAVILTGRPPFAASSADTARVRAAQGDVGECFGRLDACGAEPELVALAKQCLAAKPHERPADAGAVATAVAELRAAADERARQAELDRVKAEGERATAEARADEEVKTRRVVEEKVAEQRKRRRVQRALAAAVGLLVATGAAFAWWADHAAGRQRELAATAAADQARVDGERKAEQAAAAAEQRVRAERTVTALADLLDRADDALRADDAGRAAPLVDEAVRRAADDGAAVHAPRLARCRADLALLRDLDRIDDLAFTWAGGKLLADQAVLEWPGAFARFGVDPGVTPVAAAAARINGSIVRDRALAALDRWLVLSRSEAVREVVAAADPDPYRNQVRRVVRAGKAGGWDGWRAVAVRPELADQPPRFLLPLVGTWPFPPDRRADLLRRIHAATAGRFGAIMTLAETEREDAYERRLPGPRTADARAGWFRAALAVRPNNPTAWNSLGVSYFDKKDYAAAAACFRRVTDLDPGYTHAYLNLGGAQSATGNYDGAVASFRKVLELDPHSPHAHANLGVVARSRGDLPAAERHLADALRANPGFAFAHSALGMTRILALDWVGAQTAYAEAVRLDPDDADAAGQLGYLANRRGDLPGTVDWFRTATRLDPGEAKYHINLGAALAGLRDYPAAADALREAVRLNPTVPHGHDNLGTVLSAQGDEAGAVRCFREAIRLDPKYANGYYNLGVSLATLGQFEEAAAAYREAIRLAPSNPQPRNNLARLERTRELFLRLPGVLSGTARPAAPGEALEFADLCSRPSQRRYAVAARLAGGAFAADPKLADDLAAQHRYNAACYAARAARGDGVDAPADPGERGALRAKALGWLRADLAARQKQAASANPADRKAAADALTHWLGNPDLSGGRPGLRRIGMPAAERAEWDAFWADAKATIAEARKPSPPPEVTPPPRETER